MPSWYLTLPALLSLWLGLTLCPAKLAWAGAFTVDPLQVVLSAKTLSGLVTLRNHSAEPLRVQLSVWAWEQSPQGEMRLSPTEDLVWFPTLLILVPGETRRIRLGAATSFAAIEKSYRLFVEELPPLETPQADTGGVQLRILTRVGIPIFLQPAHSVVGGLIEAVATHHGQLSFQVTNTGTIHVVVQTVRVLGLGEAGEPVFEQQLSGWYILAGGVRIYTLELPQAVCAKIVALVLEVQMDQATVKAYVDRPSGTCRQS